MNELSFYFFRNFLISSYTQSLWFQDSWIWVYGNRFNSLLWTTYIRCALVITFSYYQHFFRLPVQFTTYLMPELLSRIIINHPFPPSYRLSASFPTYHLPSLPRPLSPLLPTLYSLTSVIPATGITILTLIIYIYSPSRHPLSFYHSYRSLLHLPSFLPASLLSSFDRRDRNVRIICVVR